MEVIIKPDADAVSKERDLEQSRGADGESAGRAAVRRSGKRLRAKARCEIVAPFYAAIGVGIEASERRRRCFKHLTQNRALLRERLGYETR